MKSTHTPTHSREKRSRTFVFHVVGDDDADEESQANHTADKDEQVNKHSVFLFNTKHKTLYTCTLV